jgi:putative ABC transport system ATP-binding protein
MDLSLFRFVIKYSKFEQIVLLAVTLLSFPFTYYSLDLPRQIINVITRDSSDPFQPVTMFGFAFDQVAYLMFLSAQFMAFVLINLGFKYFINTYKGKLGERMLRRLRYELYARILRFRLPHFRGTSQGELIPMITSEVEPLGGFIGDAFVQPIWQAGTMLTGLVFIFIQDPFLGAAAVALYPFQGWIIPKLQRRVNQLGKMRVRTLRMLADRIGESVSGVVEIHTHDTSAPHLADFSQRLGDIYDIRYEIYSRKHFVKGLNNFINQLTPFFFYSIGGYFAIIGTISAGSLVAVLNAYKDLAAPWKELLDYYQMKEDTRIKYEQIVQQFQPSSMQAAEQLASDDVLDGPLPALAFANVTYSPDGRVATIEDLTADVPTDRHIAVLGIGSSKDDFLLLAARLVVPTGGTIRLGDRDYKDLPESITGRRLAYVGPHSHIFTETVRGNLYYALAHRPLVAPSYDEAERRRRERRAAASRASGNTDFDIDADWIDYAAAGVDGPEALHDRALELLRAVELEPDIYRLGLIASIDPAARPDITDKVLQARALMAQRLAAAEDPELVELFDKNRYNQSASVAENLLFGTPVGEVFRHDGLARHPYVLAVLAKTGLADSFVHMGAEVAETMIELFADLPPGHPFFEQYSFIGADELADFQPLVDKVMADPKTLKPDERARLTALPFKLIEGRHRLGMIDAAMQERLLVARRVFAAELPQDLAPHIEFFDASRYASAASIQDNILFGKIRYGKPMAAERVQQMIEAAVQEVGLRHLVSAVGLDAPVGVAGGRLSTAQRQKLAIARALMKRPDLLILNECLTALDGPSQQRVAAAIRKAQNERGLLWGLQQPAFARDFDEVMVVRHGRIAERGSYAELDRDDSILRRLMQ